MKLTYLGTAAAEGWPALFCRCDACNKARELGGKNIRTRSQALINDDLLLDYPPDAYMHALTGSFSWASIKTVLVTHSHQDHLYPQDFALRAFPYAHKIDGNKLTIYGNENVCKIVNETLSKSDAQGIETSVAVQQLEPFVTVQIDEKYLVTPLVVTHKKDEQCFIYLIEQAGKTLLYAHDTGFFPKETWEYLNGKHLDFISLDCTMMDIPDGKNHMGIEDDVKLVKELKAIGCVSNDTALMLNHFSHNGGYMHEEIEKKVQPYQMQVSYDGMQVTI